MSSAKIPEKVKLKTKQRILNYAEQNYAGKYLPAYKECVFMGISVM